MKRLIKFRLPYLFAAAFLLLCIGISCSEDPTWTKPTPEQEEIIPAVFIEDLVMPDAEEIFIPEDPIKIMGTGFDKYDVFLFRSTSEDPAEETKYFQAEISEVAEDYVIITVPKTIDLRSYELILKRYNKQQVLGPMTIYKAHFPAIPDQAGMTVKGRGKRRSQTWWCPTESSSPRPTRTASITCPRRRKWGTYSFPSPPDTTSRAKRVIRPSRP